MALNGKIQGRSHPPNTTAQTQDPPTLTDPVARGLGAGGEPIRTGPVAHRRAHPPATLTPPPPPSHPITIAATPTRGVYRAPSGPEGNPRRNTPPRDDVSARLGPIGAEQRFEGESGKSTPARDGCGRPRV